MNVNAVGFGLIETRLIQPLTGEGAHIDIKGQQIRSAFSPKCWRREGDVSAGPARTPEEAASAVFFFCSPLSDYVTGEVLICGGGLHF